MPMTPIGPIKALIVHHTATARGVGYNGIYQIHVEENGWSDIGYHYFVPGPDYDLFPDAKPFLYCRPFDRMGAHAKGHNRGTLALAIAGDNTVEGRGWTPRQIQAGQRVIDAFQLLYPGLPVLGHREVADTLCPGVDLRDVFVLGGG